MGRYLLFLVMALAGQAALAAGEPVTLDLGCRQEPATTLTCRYRLAPPAPVKGVAARLEGKELPVSALTPYPAGKETGAYLFLVDVSDPKRQATVAKNAQVIRELLARGKPHHRFGIALFDSAVEVVAPLGAESGALDKGVGQVKARGQTTEFYRGILTGIDLLASYPAERKGLVIFSDGLAEDEAYGHEDAVRRARQAGVVIHALGYAESVAQTPALQRLRRLAEETGGPFAAADKQKELPAAVLDGLYAYLDNGGRFTVDLTGQTGEGQVELRLSRADGQELAQRQAVTLPPAPSPSKPEAKPRPMVVPSPTPTGDDAVDVISAWLAAPRVMALLGSALLLLVVMAAARLLRKPLAVLEVVGDQGRRYKMRRPLCRIGRDGGNDLRLANDSVSAVHAEIVRDRHGAFSVTDLNSTNGVRVNGRPAPTHPLHDGDLVELGEVRLRFHGTGGGA